MRAGARRLDLPDSEGSGRKRASPAARARAAAGRASWDSRPSKDWASLRLGHEPLDDERRYVARRRTGPEAGVEAELDRELAIDARPAQEQDEPLPDALPLQELDEGTSVLFVTVALGD